MLLRFILLISFLIGNVVLAQNQMVLLKRNKRIAKFEEGDAVRIRLKSEDNFIKGTITGIHKDFLMIDRDTIYIKKVCAIDLRNHPNSNFRLVDAGTKFMMAGTVLVIADLINSGNVSPGIGITSAALVISGAVLVILNNDIYKIKKRKRILIQTD